MEATSFAVNSISSYDNFGWKLFSTIPIIGFVVSKHVIESTKKEIKNNNSICDKEILRISKDFALSVVVRTIFEAAILVLLASFEIFYIPFAALQIYNTYTAICDFQTINNAANGELVEDDIL